MLSFWAIKFLTLALVFGYANASFDLTAQEIKNCTDEGVLRFETHRREYLNSNGQSLNAKKLYSVLSREEVYREMGGQKLLTKIYFPDLSGNKNSQKFPVILQIHGGGWIGGSRSDMQPYAETLASLGAIVVSPDYRIAPKDLFPAAQNDMDQIIGWVSDHSERLGIERSYGISIFGFSAGAHLGMAAITSKLRKPTDMPISRAFLISTRVDLTSDYDWGIDYAPLYIGDSRAHAIDRFIEASPLFQLGEDSNSFPPLLLASYVHDDTIRYTQSCKMWKEMKRRHSSVRVMFAPKGANHGPTPFDRQIFLQAMTYFFGY